MGWRRDLWTGVNASLNAATLISRKFSVRCTWSEIWVKNHENFSILEISPLLHAPRSSSYCSTLPAPPCQHFDVSTSMSVPHLRSETPPPPRPTAYRLQYNPVTIIASSPYKGKTSPNPALFAIRTPGNTLAP
jgi:hypothetical protein